MTVEIVREFFNTMLLSMAKVVPTVLGSILLLLIGWVLGRIVGKVVKEILEKLKADNYLKIGRKLLLSEVLPIVVSWIIYLAFIGAAVDVMQIQTLSSYFTKLLDFLANLFGGIVVLVAGYVLAGYIQRHVVETKAQYAEALGQVIFFFTLIITVSMAFDIVGLPTRLLDGIMLIIAASVGLGIAIALGLGLKDTIARLAKKRFEPS